MVLNEENLILNDTIQLQFIYSIFVWIRKILCIKRLNAKCVIRSSKAKNDEQCNGQRFVDTKG